MIPFSRTGTPIPCRKRSIALQSTRAEGDALECGAIASRDLRESHAVQLALRHGFEFGSVDELLYGCDPAGRLPDQFLAVHGKSVLTSVWSIEASVGRPA